MAEADPNLEYFTEEEINSPNYTWRNDDKQKGLKTIVFSLTNENEKNMKDDECEVRQDIDVLKMKDFYKISNNDIFRNNTIKQFKDRVSFMRTDSNLAQYDCFFIMFFTSAPKKENGCDYEEEKLLFVDDSLSIHEVLDELKTIEYFNGKPKVILIQLDNLQLWNRLKLKGGPITFQTRKIPVDADRLIIQSTIPSLCVRDLGNFDENNPPGSLLVQAFLEVMEDNRKKPVDGQSDLLSLTTVMNAKMKKKIEQLGENREKYKYPPPLPYAKVSSTFTKLLYL